MPGAKTQRKPIQLSLLQSRRWTGIDCLVSFDCSSSISPSISQFFLLGDFAPFTFPCFQFSFFKTTTTKNNFGGREDQGPRHLSPMSALWKFLQPTSKEPPPPVSSKGNAFFHPQRRTEGGWRRRRRRMEDGGGTFLALDWQAICCNKIFN